MWTKDKAIWKVVLHWLCCVGSNISYNHQFSDPDEDEDGWETKELSFSGAAAAKHGGQDSDEDSDEMEAAPDKMEVDNDDDRK